MLVIAPDLLGLLRLTWNDSN